MFRSYHFIWYILKLRSIQNVSFKIIIICCVYNSFGLDYISWRCCPCITNLIIFYLSNFYCIFFQFCNLWFMILYFYLLRWDKVFIKKITKQFRFFKYFFLRSNHCIYYCDYNICFRLNQPCNCSTFFFYFFLSSPFFLFTMCLFDFNIVISFCWIDLLDIHNIWYLYQYQWNQHSSFQYSNTWFWSFVCFRNFYNLFEWFW